MKKLTILMFVFVSTLCFNACVEDEDPAFVLQESQSEGPLIVTANSSVILDRETQDNQAFTLVWEDAGYNINTPISYTIEAAVAGTNFETPQQVAITSDRFYNWTIGELNSLAISTGLSANIEASLELRVISSIGTNGGASIDSNVIALTMTPYQTVIPRKDLFLVGNATAAGWENNGNNPPLVRDPDNISLFKYTGKFLGGENAFKFLEVKGQWQPQWGLSGGSLSSSDILGGDPDVFSVATDGYYELTVNIEDLTYDIQPFDTTGATVYAQMGIIGDATAGGWDTDTDMTKSTFDEHLWYINDVVLSDGEMKIRADDDWTNSWGASSAISGQGTNNNDPNIPVTAGTYDIWFSDLDGRFIFIPKG